MYNLIHRESLLDSLLKVALSNAAHDSHNSLKSQDRVLILTIFDGIELLESCSYISYYPVAFPASADNREAATSNFPRIETAIMKIEYLILNFLIVAGPLALSFENEMRFVAKWRFAIPAILIVAIPFLVWDAMVTGKHWWFNENYTLDFRVMGLPIEECMFFFTVPFAGIFIWESLRFNYSNRLIDGMRFVYYLFYSCAPIGVLLFIQGKEYSGLMFFSLAITALYDRLSKTRLLLQKLLYVYLAIAAALILLFNGFLTARPVVLYDYRYQLGFKIFTIPIEDFGYGFSLLLLATMLYEKFKAGANG